MYTSAAYSECRRRNTTATLVQWVHTLWLLSFISVVIQARTSWLPKNQVVRNLTYPLHVDRGYRVSLRPQEYTERGTTDNNCMQEKSVSGYCQ